MNIWLTALVLGVSGSLHCAFMCGPLVLAATSKQPRVLLNKVTYNGGRILTYALLGGITGSFGLALDLTGWKTGVAVVMGLGLIVFAIAGITHIQVPFVSGMMSRLQNKLRIAFSYFLAKKTHLAMLTLGMLNGLVPCGLTYVALAYTLTLDPLSGFLFMLFFGVATLPSMLGLTAFLHRGLQARFSVRGVTVSVMIIAGILMLSRTFTHMPHLAAGPSEITVCGN